MGRGCSLPILSCLKEGTGSLILRCQCEKVSKGVSTFPIHRASFLCCQSLSAVSRQLPSSWWSTPYSSSFIVKHFPVRKRRRKNHGRGTHTYVQQSKERSRHEPTYLQSQPPGFPNSILQRPACLHLDSYSYQSEGALRYEPTCIPSTRAHRVQHVSDLSSWIRPDRDPGSDRHRFSKSFHRAGIFQRLVPPHRLLGNATLTARRLARPVDWCCHRLPCL